MTTRDRIQRPRSGIATLGLAVLLVMAVLVTAGGRRTFAAQFDVTTTADTGPGSLRQALLEAIATTILAS